MKQQAIFIDLGTNRAYKEIWDFQEALLQEKVQAKTEQRNQSSKLHGQGVDPTFRFTATTSQASNHLLFVEHNPVYTLGKSGNENHVLINEQQRGEKQIEYFRINRGGDITFHGPGQLVGYPILDLDNFKTDLGWYLRSLEEVIILTMKEYNLQGGRSAGETGVWLEADVKGKERKICAMGIRCSRWITMHGFALNVNTDLNYFDYIVPCGIQNKKVTSLEKELGFAVSMADVKQKVKKNFESVFDVELIHSEK